ncbi:MAG: type II secretion system F family protein [Actinomycetota bacterium]|nr:type II secretion system F family protein [Actinomycetota bacterium]
MIRGTLIALASALILAAPSASAAQREPLQIEHIQRAGNNIRFKVLTTAGRELSASDLNVKVNDYASSSAEVTPPESSGGSDGGSRPAYRVVVSNPDPAAVVYEIEVSLEGGDGAGGGRVRKQAQLGDQSSPGFVVPAGAAGIASPLLLAIIFCTVALCVATFSEWLRRRRLSPRSRLRWYDEPAAPGPDAEGLINAAVLKRAKEIATRLADRSGHLERIELAIESAGMRWRPGELIVASAGLSLAGGALLGSLGGPLWALIGAAGGGFAPTLYIRRTAATRKQAFYEQLSDVLLLLSGALKAGYSLQQAVATAGEDAKPPASEEFRRAMAEVRLGASLDDALEALARRSRMVDLEWSVLAIQIQREVGGNLAEILETIAGTIRERERLRRELRTLTAEGRLSGWVLGLLPFAIGSFLALRSPAYLEPLYSTGKGLVMVSVSAVLLIVGTLWMRKIVKVEV